MDKTFLKKVQLMNAQATGILKAANKINEIPLGDDVSNLGVINAELMTIAFAVEVYLKHF